MHAVGNINTTTNGLVVSRHDKLRKIELPKSRNREQFRTRKEEIPYKKYCLSMETPLLDCKQHPPNFAQRWCATRLATTASKQTSLKT